MLAVLAASVAPILLLLLLDPRPNSVYTTHPVHASSRLDSLPDRLFTQLPGQQVVKSRANSLWEARGFGYLGLMEV
jgi:hypothetical protein